MTPDPVDATVQPSDIGRLLTAAQEWIRADPDPATREQLRRVVVRGDPEELSELLDGRLQFGTAGLRAALGPGPNRMNRAVVRRAAAGLSRHLLASVEDCRRRGVVVGRDSRHGSDAFARDVVEVLTSHGIEVHAFVDPVPTPLTACTVLQLDACAGVVVTASHNPASDNGMKVYWTDGAQIVAPVDVAIAAAIDEVATDGHVLPPDGGPPAAVHDLGAATSDDACVVAYVERAVSIARNGLTDTDEEQIRLAATSLHGVGAQLLERVLRAGGYTDLHQVASQREPDPDFPTVEFPNPEEPGALDQLFDLAGMVRADLAIANDPDADRLAVAVPDRSGSWRALSGDDTGALLANHLLEHSNDTPPRLLATTVVSSRLVSAMAAAAGVQFRETLTGFKWLCRPGIEHPEWQQVLLYEEALGYAIGPSSRDKDGIVAALVFADLVSGLRRRDRTVWDVLDELAERHGAHVQRNGSVRPAGAGAQSRLTSLVDSLVEAPPRRLGGQRVERAERPDADVLRLVLADDTRVIVRPSGTEPKLKYYCEAIEPVRASVADARAIAAERLDRVADELAGLLA